MSVPGRVYKRCGCLNPGTRRRWGSHCPQLTRTGHGSWYLTVELPTGPSGARRQLRRGGYRTRTEVERALTALRQPHSSDPRRELLTTGQWLQHWLATLLHELCLDDVQTTLVILARTPTRSGRARAASTLHRIRATLRVALNAAMRRGLIEANPARYVELPPASRPSAVVWTQARVAHWRATGEHPPGRSLDCPPDRAVPPLHPPAPPLPAVPADHPGRTAPRRGLCIAGAMWTCTTGRCWSAGNSSSTVASSPSATLRPPAASA